MVISFSVINYVVNEASSRERRRLIFVIGDVRSP